MQLHRAAVSCSSAHLNDLEIVVDIPRNSAMGDVPSGGELAIAPGSTVFESLSISDCTFVSDAAALDADAVASSPKVVSAPMCSSASDEVVRLGGVGGASAFSQRRRAAFSWETRNSSRMLPTRENTCDEGHCASESSRRRRKLSSDRRTAALIHSWHL